MLFIHDAFGGDVEKESCPGDASKIISLRKRKNAATNQQPFIVEKQDSNGNTTYEYGVKYESSNGPAYKTYGSNSYRLAAELMAQNWSSVPLSAQSAS